MNWILDVAAFTMRLMAIHDLDSIQYIVVPWWGWVLYIFINVLTEF